MQATPKLSTTPPLPGVVAVPALNDALQTIATDFSGDTDPAALAWPFSKWADTANMLIKRRNAANSAWVIEGSLLRSHLASIPSDEIPVSDIGAIYVQGVGVMEWNGFSAYKPLAMQQWASKALGEPFYLRDDLPGVAAPPNTIQGMRFIKLTASDAYNTGLLTSETVSGSAPLVVATAEISLAGSPLNGAIVNLINTERRVWRAGASGSVENDQFQGFLIGDGAGLLSRLTGITYAAGGTATAHIGGTGPLVRMTDGVNGTPRAGTETRAKSIGATAYMRIL